MRDAAIIFVAQFAYVFLLGFQSRNVRDGDYGGAMVTSLCLGVCGLVVQPMIIRAALIDPSPAVLIAFLVSGPFAIASAMFVHDSMGVYRVGKKNKLFVRVDPVSNQPHPDEVRSEILPDSGSRSAFDTGAVRDAATGKGLPSSIPYVAILKLARRFEDGRSKYPDDEQGRPNWQKGIPLSRFHDAIVRHSFQHANGDTSEDHLGAVLWNAAAWAWTEGQIAAGKLPRSLDDLPFR